MIKFKVTGVQEVKAFIESLPRGTKISAMRAIVEYVIGDTYHGLRHYPAYRYVSRASAYGKTFSSDKQRRYVMAMIREGRITPGVPQRSGAYGEGWGYAETNSQWDRVEVKNTVPYSGYVGGLNQARLLGKVGWRKWPEVVADNIRGAIAAGQAAVNEWIKQHWFGGRY